MQFDTSVVPSGATILQATANLCRTAPVGGTVSVHPVLVPWTESTVTWNSIGANFGAAFGSFISTGGPPTTYCDIQFDLTASAQSWVSGAPNYGILLDQPAGQNTFYRTSEHPPVYDRPRLDVCYMMP